VGSELLTTLTSVKPDHVVGVNGEEAVGVDGDAEKARIGVDNLGLIAKLEVVEHSGLRQVTKLGAVIDTVELGGIEALSILLIDNLLLSIVNKTGDNDGRVRVIKDLSHGILLLFGIWLHPDELLIRREVELEARGAAIDQILLVIAAA